MAQGFHTYHGSWVKILVYNWDLPTKHWVLNKTSAKKQSNSHITVEKKGSNINQNTLVIMHPKQQSKALSAQKKKNTKQQSTALSAQKKRCNAYNKALGAHEKNLQCMNQSTGCSEENSKYVHVIKKKIYIFLKKITNINLANGCLGFHTWMVLAGLWGCVLMVPSMLGGAWIAVVPLVATGQCGVWLHPGRSSRWCLPAAPICSANPVSPLDATWLLLWQQLLVGGPLGGVTGALAPLDGLEGPDGSLAVAFMDGPDGPINGLAGLGGRPGWTGLAGSLATLGGLVPGGGMGHVHGCPGGSMGGMGYGALGHIGLAALMAAVLGISLSGCLWQLENLVAPSLECQTTWLVWLSWMGQMVQLMDWLGWEVDLDGLAWQVHLEHLVALCLEVAWAMYMDVLEVAWVAWGMVHLVALVWLPWWGHSMVAAVLGDLTVWMPLATGEPGGTELGGNLGVKPPWLVLTGCALAACQYNAAGALTKRKINQPLRLLAGQVAMAPAGDVRYMTNEYYITMSNGLGILGNSWSWRLLLGIHNWLLLGNSWANLPAQTKQKN